MVWPPPVVPVVPLDPEVVEPPVVPPEDPLVLPLPKLLVPEPVSTLPLNVSPGVRTL